MTEPQTNIVWQPNAGPQTRFLACSAYEALYGGQAGGGKSDALLIDPLRYVHLPFFRAVLFRRSYPELERSLIERSHQYYPALFPNARWNEQKHFWHFPPKRGGTGARIYFSHLERERDVHQHQSVEYQREYFDELTSFTQKQYTYLLTRARSSRKGVPIAIRSATNPGNAGHEWVLERWAPWLIPGDHDQYTGPIALPEFPVPGLELVPIPRSNELRPVALPGQVLWIAVMDGRDVVVPRGTPGALSRTFIPASIQDNPKLLENDPDYQARIDALDPVERARLKKGDWLIKPGRGKYFQRAWCTYASALEVPRGIQWFRFWDFAGTEKTDTKSDPDWTAGVKLGIDAAHRVWIADVVHFRGSPQEVERRLLATAELDGPDTIIGLEQDGGQSGKHQAVQFLRLLSRFRVKRVSPSGDKLQRFGPFSAQAEGGRVVLVTGAWNAAYTAELQAFPEGSHDDQVDATSGAYMMASGGPRPGGLFFVRSGR
ncbi:MAG: phage terminase large subunit [Polyangiaceae bacterium]